MRRWWTWLAALALGAGLALPASAENVVRWGAIQGAVTFDPHASDTQHTSQVVRHVYETLTTDDLIARIEPVLAVSWRLAAPRVWEFELRRGVTFHDGTPLTSEDAVPATGEATILVAADNDDNRCTLVNRLRREGYANVAVAADGREALARLAAIRALPAPEQAGRH